MKAYVFGWLCKINHMKIFSSQKRYCQEVILFSLMLLFLRAQVLGYQARPGPRCYIIGRAPLHKARYSGGLRSSPPSYKTHEGLAQALRALTLKGPEGPSAICNSAPHRALLLFNRVLCSKAPGYPES